MNEPLDCIVIGGGAAGLSAALVLGRARRSTLVLDGGGQSNLPAHAIGGLLAQEGTSPAQLYATAHAQLAGYPSVELRAATVERVAAEADGEGFVAELEDGSRETAKRIVFATGTDYVAPQLPGLAQLWGRSAFHCPFCHGWEVRDRPLAVLANGEHAPLHAQLLRNWSDDVVLLSDGPAGLGEHGADELAAAGVRLDERPVAELLHDRAAGSDGAPALRAIRFADGDELAREGILVATAMEPRTALAAQLGVQLDTRGAIVVDPYQRTSVAGVFAAGDAGGGMQVSAAYGTGSAAGAWATQSLIADDNGRAFQPPPLPQPAP